MGISSLTIVLPCCNEEENVALWERELLPRLAALSIPVECIVVDDGSRDRTHDVATALAARDGRVRVLRHDGNRGLGAAVRSALAVATGEAILTLDADLTFSPELIPVMIGALTPDVGCVCASPFLGGFHGVGLLRRILSAGVNLIYRGVLGRKITAVSSICRLYRTSDLNKISLNSTSFDINAEIIFRLLQAGVRVVEVPAVLGTRRFGTSKISTAREIRNHLRMFLRIAAWRIAA
jgi:dolichol-phosphate mannosyltransferase